MLNISQWWTHNATDKTWLVAGQDASLQSHGEFDLSEFSILALDGALETLERADIAATLDLKHIKASGDAMDARAGFVLLPRYANLNGQLPNQNRWTRFSTIFPCSKNGTKRAVCWFAISRLRPLKAALKRFFPPGQMRRKP